MEPHGTVRLTARWHRSRAKIVAKKPMNAGKIAIGALVPSHKPT
jgi:hypothetical protein